MSQQQPAAEGVVFAQLYVSDRIVQLCPVSRIPDERIRELLGNGTHNLYAAAPAKVGELVLFPREPTAKILLALSHALGIEPLGEDANEGYPITGQQSTVRQYYAALIAAAPAKVAVPKEVFERAYAAYERTRWTGRPESPPPAKHYQAIRAAIEDVLNGDAGS